MTFIDTNVVLDIVSDDPLWFDWSAEQLRTAEARGPLLINDVIYAEVSVRFASIEELDAQVAELRLVRRPMPTPALFLAAKAFSGLSSFRWLSFEHSAGPVHRCTGGVRRDPARNPRSGTLSNLLSKADADLPSA